MKRSISTAIACLLAMLISSMPADGQNDGRFTGAVLDSSGASVAGADVTAKNERTGEVRTVKSNEKGVFVIANLKPATYTLRAVFGQFTPLEITGLQLVAGQEFAIDLNMNPAGVSEEVRVVDTATAIDLSSARIGVNVGEKEINALPLNGRQMSQLMLQSPGSVNIGQGTWADIRFSGRANQQNAVRFDGIEASGIIDASPGQANGELATPFKLQASLENVQECRVEANNYPAESGTGTGGQINVVTKSGGNSFRGSVFEYFRDEGMDSPNYFEKLNGFPKANLGLNQFGGSIGGPIKKDRIFFFASYEGYRVDAGINLIEYVPSEAAWAKAVPSIAVLKPAFT